MRCVGRKIANPSSSTIHPTYISLPPHVCSLMQFHVPMSTCSSLGSQTSAALPDSGSRWSLLLSNCQLCVYACACVQDCRPIHGLQTCPNLSSNASKIKFPAILRAYAQECLPITGGSIPALIFPQTSSTLVQVSP